MVTVIEDEFKNKTCCGNHYLYGLSNWAKSEFICSDCFLQFLIMNQSEIIVND